MHPYKKPLAMPPPPDWPFTRETIAYGAIQAGLIAAKLLGLVGWSWWWIASPTLLVALGLAAVIFAILWLSEDHE